MCGGKRGGARRDEPPFPSLLLSICLPSLRTPHTPNTTTTTLDRKSNRTLVTLPFTIHAQCLVSGQPPFACSFVRRSRERNGDKREPSLLPTATHENAARSPLKTRARPSRQPENFERTRAEVPARYAAIPADPRRRGGRFEQQKQQKNTTRRRRLRAAPPHQTRDRPARRHLCPVAPALGAVSILSISVSCWPRALCQDTAS